MRKAISAGLLLATAVLWSFVAVAQPPEGGGPRGKGGREEGMGPSGPPRFVLGRVISPHVREELDLTPQQQEQIAKLEADVKKRLTKILTTAQREKLRSIGPPDRRGEEGPPDGNRPPDEGDGEPKSKSETPKRKAAKRPDVPQTTKTAGRAIQWFATWRSGLEEAQRTGKPILFLSAAASCGGVSGIW